MSNPRVEQTGDITPGHTVLWTTTGVIQDGGAPSGGGGGGGGGGTGSAITGLLNFSTPAAAEAGTIPDNTNFVTVQGFRTPGDGGGATYQRVLSLPSPYVADGLTTPFVPPSFSSGGVPTTCFVTTFATASLHSYIFQTIAPIQAGCLTILTVIEGPNPDLASITDSAGNTYLLAGSVTGLASMYYCLNPVFAPVGTTFNLGPLTTARLLNVYNFPTFTGAILDQVATNFNGSSTNGATITTPTLTGFPELVFAMIDVFETNSVLNPGVPGLNYTVPTGWIDLQPPINGKNPIGCIVVNSTSPVTFNPTWPPIAPAAASGVIATFKTFPTKTIDASFWSLLPSVPLHTAAFGIDPTAPDNVNPFRAFGRYLATTAPASGGFNQGGAGTPVSGSVTISVANPAVITIIPDARLTSSHGLHAGQMVSFQTTGALPTGIVANQIYYIQYGTVTPTTFQISSTPLFDPVPGVNGGSQTQPIGTPIVTSGAQTGTHSCTVYGQSWTDFILDPGVYSASQNQTLGLGTGIQKWRLLGYGARVATNMNVFGSCTNDINANTGGSTFAYTAQFQSTIEVHNSGNFNNYVILNTPGQAVNFYVNSWVILMCIEQQASADGNWNPAIFEYARIQTIDAGTGIITFWNDIQYNYRSTYPKFKSQSFALTGGQTGSATIVQMSDVFDQEIEIHGLNMWGVTEQTVGGVRSLKFIDCDMWGWAFDSGPSPVFVRRYEVLNCRFHNCVPEIDKMIDYVHYADCDFDQASFPRFQSASINKAVFDRCKLMGGFSGTPKDLTIRDSFIAGTFTVGPVYGSTQRMTLVNTNIERVINNDQATEVLIVGLSGVTFVSGTIKIAAGTTTVYGLWSGPNTVSVTPAPWAQPGAKILVDISASVTNSGSINCQATCGMVTAFTVLDVYTDGSGNFCIDTDVAALPNTGTSVTATVSGTTLHVTAISPAGAILLRGTIISGGGLPAGTVITVDIPLPAASSLGNYQISNSASIGSTVFTATMPMNFLPHPCPRLTMINCTGGRFAADMAGAPPDIPMFSYFKRAFAGTTIAVATHENELFLAGNLLNWTINVLKPYTGAGANYVCVIQVFGFAISGGVTYPTIISQTIDLTTTGIRTITATGTTGSVGADSISPIPFWLSGGHVVVIGISPTFIPNGGDTMANMPFFIMQAQTDHGVDFASMTVNTQTGARPAGTVDQFADTTTMTAQP